MSTVSKKLLKKIIEQFPEIPQPTNPDQKQLRRVYSNNDGSAFKWSNFGVQGHHIFSYETMSICLKNEIKARWCNGIGHGPVGWEIYT